MQRLFELDARNYDPGWPRRRRPSVRAVIRRGRAVAVVRSLLYDYCKFPGGGIEPGETPEEALRREVAEEAGLAVVPGSLRPLGSALRIERAPGREEVFEQENLYYLCDVEPGPPGPRRLDPYEAEERFELQWLDPAAAAAVNRRPGHGPKSPLMIEREARVFDLLAADCPAAPPEPSDRPAAR